MVSIAKKYRPFLLYGLLLTLTTMFLPAKGQSNDTGAVPYHWASGDPLPLWTASSYPTDPTQLGTTLPVLTLPIQAEWDAMDEAEKALWLINQERSDRGIDPLEQIEANVTAVAQTYADYLLDNDAWGHYEDGRSPWDRLQDNPEIGACYDNLSVAENLAVFVSTGSIPLPVERSVYMWMYDDAGSICGILIPTTAVCRGWRAFWGSGEQAVGPMRDHLLMYGHLPK